MILAFSSLNSHDFAVTDPPTRRMVQVLRGGFNPNRGKFVQAANYPRKSDRSRTYLPLCGSPFRLLGIGASAQDVFGIGEMKSTCWLVHSFSRVKNC